MQYSSLFKFSRKKEIFKALSEQSSILKQFEYQHRQIYFQEMVQVFTRMKQKKEAAEIDDCRNIESFISDDSVQSFEELGDSNERTASIKQNKIVGDQGQGRLHGSSICNQVYLQKSNSFIADEPHLMHYLFDQGQFLCINCMSTKFIKQDGSGGGTGKQSLVSVIDYSSSVLNNDQTQVNSEWVAQEMAKEENIDVSHQIENNYLL